MAVTVQFSGALQRDIAISQTPDDRKSSSVRGGRGERCVMVIHVRGSSRRLINLDFAHGRIERVQNQNTYDAFQKGEMDALVLNRKIGGVELNLTRATDIVHYDQDWNPATEAQTNDRAYRLGQTRDVYVHLLETVGTVEEKVRARVAGKRELADAAVPVGEIDFSQWSDTEIIDLFTRGH